MFCQCSAAGILTFEWTIPTRRFAGSGCFCNSTSVDIFRSRLQRDGDLGGLCGRVFELAKQTLDDRDDPNRPTLVLSRADVVAGCARLPALADRDVRRA